MADRSKAKTFNAFRRQLSLYGFKRDGARFEQPFFSHPFFVRGREELLKEITRRRQAGAQSKLSLDLRLLQTCQNRLERITATEEEEAHKEEVKELLLYIKGLSRYKGVGLPFFLKGVTLRLTKIFPEVHQKLERDISNTSTIMGRTQFLREEETVNKKEVIVALMNRMLAEVHKELMTREVDPVYFDFNKDLDDLGELSCTFKRPTSGPIDKAPLSVEKRFSDLESPMFKNLFCGNGFIEPSIPGSCDEDTLSQMVSYLLN